MPMTDESIQLKPITPNLYGIYMKVGTRAYNQHYEHLWKNGNTKPYLESSFTIKILHRESEDPNTELSLIYLKKAPVGIVKISKDKALSPYTSQEAILVDKIYILKAYSGQGIGSKILSLVCQQAKAMSKKILWLDTMQKGPALAFYKKHDFEVYAETEVAFPRVLSSQKAMYILIKRLTHDKGL